MKILQIMGGAREGGAEEFFIEAVEALKNKEINQYVVINKKNQIADICTFINKCSIEEISKYLLKQGKKRNFPDITIRE